MINKIRSQTNNSRILSQVWLIGALGIISGCLTLGLLMWTLGGIKADRADAVAYDMALTEVNGQYTVNVAAAREDLTRILAGADSSPTGPLWADQLQTQVERAQKLFVNTANPREFDSISELIDRLHATYQASSAWREETNSGE